MKTKQFLFALIICGCAAALLADETRPKWKPRDGFVPNAETAIRIAEAVWLPIYGKETTEEERPFKASLTNGIWTVEGTLPEGMVGGVALAKISKADGTILEVIHGK